MKDLRFIGYLALFTFLFSGVAYATTTLFPNQGGTGISYATGIQTGSILYGQGTSAMATSSNLSFDGSILTATNASTTFLSVNNNEISGERYISGKLATTTTWTATSSMLTPFGDAYEIIPTFSGQATKFIASTTAGSLELAVITGSNTFYYPASTTGGVYSPSFTVTRNVPIYIIGGNPASSPTVIPFTLTITGY